jgi:hypothetical protein
VQPHLAVPQAALLQAGSSSSSLVPLVVCGWTSRLRSVLEVRGVLAAAAAAACPGAYRLHPNRSPLLLRRRRRQLRQLGLVHQRSGHLL